MVEATLVDEQLKRIKFNVQGWNRAEALELASIILPNEEIFECVNGWYEGGFSLICATNIRILLIDKKPFKYLTVEDLRFDMINEIDYSHRMFDARIRISTGPKVLTFRSYNQQRLRKLISHVQHRMAEIKNEQTAQNTKQQEHLKQIDQRLEQYLVAQYQQHQTIKKQLEDVETAVDIHTDSEDTIHETVPLVIDGAGYRKYSPKLDKPVSVAELYEEGRKEVFSAAKTVAQASRVPFSNLPAIFRHRQFGRTLLNRLLNDSAT